MPTINKFTIAGCEIRINEVKSKRHWQVPFEYHVSVSFPNEPAKRIDGWWETESGAALGILQWMEKSTRWKAGRAYHEAIEWIAVNDDPGSADSFSVKTVKGYLTVVMIADVFRMKDGDVARDVIKIRKAIKDGTYPEPE